MVVPWSAAHLITSRTVRRTLGCGCAGAAALVALPLLVLVGAVSGVTSGSDPGANQVDAASGMVIGSAEPIAAGRFTVSQGFGCTTVATEPSPPRRYACPPDAAHAQFVRFHTGIDLAAPIGVPVFAVVSGTVHVVDSDAGFGIHILLTPTTDQVTGVVYLYGHLSAVAVADGQPVQGGQAIGSVGSTGNSTGPHLHFEVDVDGTPVNPCSTFPTGYLVPAGVAAAGCLAWSIESRPAP